MIIRKYENRKLYDTESHKYITLVDVLKFIKEDKEIKVIDCQEKDITKHVLVKCMALNPEKYSLESLISFLS